MNERLLFEFKLLDIVKSQRKNFSWICHLKVHGSVSLLFKINNFPCVYSKAIPRSTIFEMQHLPPFHFLYVENNIFFSNVSFYILKCTLLICIMWGFAVHTTLMLDNPLSILSEQKNCIREILHCFHLIFFFNATAVQFSCLIMSSQQGHQIVWFQKILKSIIKLFLFK